MRPARRSIKNQRAALGVPVPDIHRGVGVRFVSTTSADVGVLMTFANGTAAGAI